MRLKLLRKLFVIGAFLIAAFSMNAQNCIDYHKSACQKAEDGSGYSYSDVSRSGLLMKGQTSEFRFDLHQGKDYRISICSDPVLGERVKFQIVDFEENTVLYDNEEFNYAKDFEFTVLTSRNVKVVVTVPADDKTQTTTSIGFKPKPTQMGCVGVMVEAMVTPKKGF